MLNLFNLIILSVISLTAVQAQKLKRRKEIRGHFKEIYHINFHYAMTTKVLGVTRRTSNLRQPISDLPVKR
jgi:hypothetical protein